MPPKNLSSLAHWITLHSRPLLQSPWLSIFQQNVKTGPNRFIPDFYLIKEKKWAMTVPLVRSSLLQTSENIHGNDGDERDSSRAPIQDIRLLMIRQYRHGASNLSWEFPAGQIDEEEEPSNAAIRELREETGASNVKMLKDLGHIYAEPARNTNLGYGYLVVCDWEEEEDMEIDEGVSREQDGEVSPRQKKHEQVLDMHENIEVKAFSLREVLAMIERGEIFHGAHLGFCMKAYLHMTERGLNGLKEDHHGICGEKGHKG
mmetsp:Transcript_1610/g.5523  ORF Transcript_1610/g.5523 Transcript_1610/m.5523 type:complete len:260 (+) Transcript_1610:55-834(+)